MSYSYLQMFTVPEYHKMARLLALHLFVLRGLYCQWRHQHHHRYAGKALRTDQSEVWDDRLGQWLWGCRPVHYSRLFGHSRQQTTADGSWHVPDVLGLPCVFSTTICRRRILIHYLKLVNLTFTCTLYSQLIN